MSSKVGLVKPNDHIVVVQMISDSLVVKVNLLSQCLPSARCRPITRAGSIWLCGS